MKSPFALAVGSLLWSACWSRRCSPAATSVAKCNNGLNSRLRRLDPCWSGDDLNGPRPSPMRSRPQRFGLGEVPGCQDIETGRDGLGPTGFVPGGYATNHMFGGQFRLHSIVADLWVSYGWAGFVFALAILGSLVGSLSRPFVASRASRSVIFAVMLAFWSIVFGPIFSNWLDVCFALGFSLVALHCDESESTDPGSAEPDSAELGFIDPANRSHPRRIRQS